MLIARRAGPSYSRLTMLIGPMIRMLPLSPCLSSDPTILTYDKIVKTQALSKYPGSL
uniref:Uncharacterized protein n=1 Tax=Picea glauca TaxID=3330 RepID=A0A117NJ43_PICGL|nr:hypothetical protein ABT39_MTgene777 [Picea glauca]